MIALNLEATNTEQSILKDYLENNVSAILADKINNGVKIEKDGKTLCNKKDFTGFMQYACEEAQKQAETGARFACIDNQTVFGWAIHYFEEDSIEGTVFNEDGTEYKPPTPVRKSVSASPAPYTPLAPKPKPQMSIFDLMNSQTESAIKPVEVAETAESDEPDQEELDEILNELDSMQDNNVTIEPEEQVLRQIGDNKYIDEDGVVHNKIPQAINMVPHVLQKLFGDKIIAR